MIIEFYQTKAGKTPCLEWLDNLKDTKAQAKILGRLDKIAHDDHLGDCKNLDGRLYELREYYGPGYRIYCTIKGNTLMIILCGEDKSSQSKDIKKARKNLDDLNS